MAFQWLRRGWLLACASAVLLAACGGGSVESQFTPARVVAFGDAFADLGQNGRRYTVNDTNPNNWTQVLATNYGRPLVASAAGGTSYATGNARVAAPVDAAGGSAPSVAAQVDAFLATGPARPDDLYILNAGVSEVIVHGRDVLAATTDTAAEAAQNTALAAVGQAGRDFATQVRRLVNAGATHVLVVGTYNLGRSPWALTSTPRRDKQIEALGGRFNQQLKIALADLGETVLYVDAELYLNLITGSPETYGLNNATTPACGEAARDPGPGIGIGPNRLNSNLCTPATVATGVNYDLYMFADEVYPTPRGQRLFGDYAVSRIRDRW